MMRARGDEGSFSLMVAVLGFAFLLLLGLVIDSARVLNARAQASADASAAARAGAGAIDPSSDPPRLMLAGGGAQTVDERVLAYCCSSIDKGTNECLTKGPFDDCTVVCENANEVVVQTKLVVKTSLLGLVGLNRITVKGTGHARPVVGVQTGEQLDTGDCTSGP